jgi:hypothetical protein
LKKSFNLFRSVANCLSEVDDQQNEPDTEELTDDIEMASIAEEEELDEKFSHQGLSTGKLSGKKKVVSKLENQNEYLTTLFSSSPSKDFREF